MELLSFAISCHVYDAAPHDAVSYIDAGGGDVKDAPRSSAYTGGMNEWIIVPTPDGDPKEENQYIRFATVLIIVENFAHILPSTWKGQMRTASPVSLHEKISSSSYDIPTTAPLAFVWLYDELPGESSSS